MFKRKKREERSENVTQVDNGGKIGLSIKIKYVSNIDCYSRIKLKIKDNRSHETIILTFAV